MWKILYKKLDLKGGVQEEPLPAHYMGPVKGGGAQVADFSKRNRRGFFLELMLTILYTNLDLERGSANLLPDLQRGVLAVSCQTTRYHWSSLMGFIVFPSSSECPTAQQGAPKKVRTTNETKV